MSGVTFLNNVIKTFEEVAEIIGIEDWLKDILKKPARTLMISIPMSMDDGHIKIFTGFRVQYCNALDPFKGGIRFHPNVTLEEVLKKLDEKIVRAFKEVLKYREKYKVNYRKAAIALAIERVTEAIKSRGVWP